MDFGMEQQRTYESAGLHEAPREPELSTTGQPMSRRRFLGAIGVGIAAAATGVLAEGCRRDERETEESATPEQPESRELSPEQTEKIINLLKTRSQAEENKDLCPQLDWSRAEKALRASPAALWSANEMEENGHKPRIYFADGTGFDIGTGAAETPPGTRNCVYDEKAAEWIREYYPNERFNGSAEAQARAMGIKLITVEQAEHIAKNTEPHYEQGWSWYATPEDTRKASNALIGYRDGGPLDVYRYNAYRHDRYRGWRGALRVDFVD